VVASLCRVRPCLICFCFGFASLSMLMPTLCVMKVWSTTLEHYIKRMKVVVL